MGNKMKFQSPNDKKITFFGIYIRVKSLRKFNIDTHRVILRFL